jgi:anthranilate/para-aminobenzoate synthase component II
MFKGVKEDFDNRKHHSCNDNLQKFITNLHKNTKDTIEDAETLKTGKCGHNFHKECIKTWKESDNEDNDNCPTCRNNY